MIKVGLNRILTVMAQAPPLLAPKLQLGSQMLASDGSLAPALSRRERVVFLAPMRRVGALCDRAAVMWRNAPPMRSHAARGNEAGIFIKAMLLYCFLWSQGFAADIDWVGINARLIRTPIVQGDFQQQKQLKFLKKPLISTGTFTYHRNKGVIWKTLKPVESLLLMNDSRLITGLNRHGESGTPPGSQASGSQAPAWEPGKALPAGFGMVFKAILGGDLTGLADEFILKGSDSKKGWQLVLTPKNEPLNQIIETLVLEGDAELHRLDIHELGGNITHIQFDKITHPAQLSDEQKADFERLSP